METVADLVADARERADPLFDAPGRPTPMTAAEAAGSAWQMGNLFRHYGVRPGDRVAVVSGPPDPSGPSDPSDLSAVQTDDGPRPGHLGSSPVPILAVLGALAAGGVVDLDPARAVGATALVVPAAWLPDYRPGPGTTAIAYGDDPGDPAVAHLEREAWSENRTPPPVDLDPTADALADDRVYLHADLVTAAHRLAVEHALDEVDRVALAAPLTTAGALVAGVLAPMVAGTTVVLGGDAPVVVAREPVESARRIDPAAAFGENT